MNVAIIDYGMGNLFSVKQACEHSGLKTVITSDAGVIANSDAAILSGVGAFGFAMENLRKQKLVEPIKEYIKGGGVFMGICLGMQLLMTESEEFGIHVGLGIIQGRVVRFPSNRTEQMLKVPQIGWNRIYMGSPEAGRKWINTPLSGIDDGTYMYFNHSFYVVPEDSQCVLSLTDYSGIRYCSSIVQDNVFACQFHPERSGGEGLRVYANWAKGILSKEKK